MDISLSVLSSVSGFGGEDEGFFASEHIRKGDAEIRAKYPDAVTHKGQRFADFMPKPSAD